MDVKKIHEIAVRECVDIDEYIELTKDLTKKISFMEDIRCLFFDSTATTVELDILLESKDKMKYIERCYFLRNNEDMPNNIIDLINENDDDSPINIFKKYFIIKKHFWKYILETEMFTKLNKKRRTDFIVILIGNSMVDELNNIDDEYIDELDMTNLIFSYQKMEDIHILLELKSKLLTKIIDKIIMIQSNRFSHFTFDNLDRLIEHINYISDEHKKEILHELVFNCGSSKLVEYLIDNNYYDGKCNQLFEHKIYTEDYVVVAKIIDFHLKKNKNELIEKMLSFFSTYRKPSGYRFIKKNTMIIRFLLEKMNDRTPFNDTDKMRLITTYILNNLGYLKRKNLSEEYLELIDQSKIIMKLLKDEIILIKCHDCYANILMDIAESKIIYEKESNIVLTDPVKIMEYFIKTNTSLAIAYIGYLERINRI